MVEKKKNVDELMDNEEEFGGMEESRNNFV